MKALILAAGLGTRLRPITDHTPKPLIKVAGKTMLKRAVDQLVKINIHQIAINIFHLADKIKTYTEQELKPAYPQIDFELIHEPQLLETGGAIKNAEYFLKSSDPFLVHNVDIIHNIDLQQLVTSWSTAETETQKKILALLTVADHPSGRPFLVDDQGYICGHRNKDKNQETISQQPTAPPLSEKRFCGVHLISNCIFDHLEPGAYSITPKYLELIKTGHLIKAFNIGNAFYADIGTESRVREVEEWLEKK